MLDDKENTIMYIPEKRKGVMRLIGHVGCAVALASPAIYFRNEMPEWLGLADEKIWALISAAAFFGSLPDIDIILQRFTPIKHRGYLTHSIFTLILIPGVILACWHAGWLNEYSWLSAVTPYVNPAFASMAFIGVLAHLLGDSMTVSGVPMFVPKKAWHMPVIGGHAAFDNPILNAVPLVVAGYILLVVFNASPRALKRLGGFGPIRKILPATHSDRSWTPRKDWRFGQPEEAEEGVSVPSTLKIDRDK